MPYTQHVTDKEGCISTPYQQANALQAAIGPPCPSTDLHEKKAKNGLLFQHRDQCAVKHNHTIHIITAGVIDIANQGNNNYDNTYDDKYSDDDDDYIPTLIQSNSHSEHDGEEDSDDEEEEGKDEEDDDYQTNNYDAYIDRDEDYSNDNDGDTNDIDDDSDGDDSSDDSNEWGDFPHGTWSPLKDNE